MVPGLEARAVVVVLDSDPAPRTSRRPRLLVDWAAHERTPQRVAFVRSAAAVPPSLQPTWDLEVAAQLREELNSLYVAMTTNCSTGRPKLASTANSC